MPVKLLQSSLHFLALFGIAYGAFVALMYVFQDQLLYLPSRAIATTPAQHGFEYDDIVLQTEDGVTLHGWFIPAQDARATLLFFHGNAGNYSHRLSSIRIFHALELNVAIISYRGYAQNTGKPSEAGTRQDATAAWYYLTQTRNIPAAQIVVFGRSLGGAVAAELASRKQPGAVILESSFTSAADLGSEIYPWLPVRLLMRHPYPVQSLLPEIKAPLLIIHSRDDEITPFHHAKALLDVASDKATLLTLTGRHNEGFLLNSEIYARGIRTFLDQHLPKP